MTEGRPPILYPLFADLTGLPGVGAKTATLFGRIGAERVRDLVFTLPVGVEDRRLRDSLAGLRPGEMATVAVTIGTARPPRSPTRPLVVPVEGGGTAFDLTFFRARGDWIARSLPEGARRIVSGRVELYDGRLQMPHPEVFTEAQAAALPPFEPVYPQTKGLTSRMIARTMAGALERLPDLPEWIAPSVIAGRHWPDWAEAVRTQHSPEGPVSLAPDHPARARLAYDELLSHALALALARARMTRQTGRNNTGDAALRTRALAAFGHPPTGAQIRAIDEITADMAGDRRMMRLLQGDVGAGKTLVALIALLNAVEAGGQGAMMAPTELLARQHARALAPLAEAAGVSLTLLTGRDKGAARTTKRAEIADGPAQIVLGTHALFQQDIAFRDLRLVIVDEQHRFGVRQRMELAAKAPDGCDVLVMTATPIPRTLALAGYGDLDVSVLDQKPPGRQPIDTALISMDRYDDVVARLGAAIDRGQRAYWVCPLVSESTEVDLVAAEARYRDLCARLGADGVRLVHGQMPAEARDAAMSDFQAGRATVLVATTVIEVGVDVPEATIMVIEQAEQFGLAQLHQLRGRVGRGAARSACLLMYAPPLGETAQARLQIMRETEDGFRIAEEDLRLRGAGDLLGTAQSGLPRLRIADFARDRALVALAHDEARLILHEDPGFASPRANALRLLLYLMERDSSVRLMRSG